IWSVAGLPSVAATVTHRKLSAAVVKKPRNIAVARSIRVFIACMGLRVGRKGAGSIGLSNPQPRDYESPAPPLSYRSGFGLLIVNGSFPASRKGAGKLV